MSVGEAFVDLHFDTSTMVREAKRAASIAVSATKIGTLGAVISGLATAALSAAPTLVQFGGALVAMAPAALVALPALVGLIAVMKTLKLATLGIKDTWAALVKGDMKAFDEAVKKLSPSARMFARELKAIFPTLKLFQLRLQESFFAQLKGDITQVTKAMLPTLERRLRQIAAVAGIAGHHFLEFFSGTYARKQVDAVLLSSTKAFNNLRFVPAQLSRAFLAVATSARPVLEDLSATAASFITQWVGDLQMAANSGAIRRTIEQGVALVQQFGTIVANVTAGIGNVLRATAAAGASPLNILTSLTQSFRNVTASASGQTAITEFFVGLKAAGGSVAALLNQIVTNILPAFGGLLTQLAPLATSLFNTLGPLLGNALRQLGPILTPLVQGLTTGLSYLGPAIAPLGAALAAAASAVGPLIGAIGGPLAATITSLAPALGPLIQLGAGLAESLLPIISSLAAALGPIIAALAKALLPVLPPIQAAFAQLAPIIAQLGVALAPVAAALGGVIGAALKALMPLLVAIVGAVAPLVGVLAKALAPILIAISPLLGVLGQLLGAILVPVIKLLAAVLTPIIQLLGAILTPIVQALSVAIDWLVGALMGNSPGGLIDALTAISAGMKIMGAVIGIVWQAIQNGVKTAVNGIIAAIAWFASLPYKFGQWFGGVLVQVRGKIGQVFAFVRSIPGTIWNVLAGLGTMAVNAGRNFIQGLINGIRNMANGVRNAVLGVLDSIRRLLPFSPAKEGPFSGRGYTLYAGQSLGAGLAAGIESQRTRVRDAMHRTVAAAQVGSPAFGGGAALAGGGGSTVAQPVNLAVNGRVFAQIMLEIERTTGIVSVSPKRGGR